MTCFYTGTCIKVRQFGCSVPVRVHSIACTHVADLEIAQQVFKRGVVRNDGRLSAAVDGADEREGQVQDVAVQQLLLLLEEHRKRL